MERVREVVKPFSSSDFEESQWRPKKPEREGEGRMLPIQEIVIS